MTETTSFQKQLEYIKQQDYFQSFLDQIDIEFLLLDNSRGLIDECIKFSDTTEGAIIWDKRNKEVLENCNNLSGGMFQR